MLFLVALSTLNLQLNGMPAHTQAWPATVQYQLALLPEKFKGPP